jgi:hypothetical protein
MRFFLFLAAFLACAGPASADRFALRFEGWALGALHIGDIAVDVDVSADTYEITTALRSRGLLNWFERTDLRAYAAGVIEAGVVRWRRYDLDHQYSRKQRSIALRAGQDGAVEAAIEPNFSSWGEPPASDTQRRMSRDPLSSVVAMAIDVGQSRRCEGAYPTFDGRFHYLLELSGGEIDGFRGGGYEGEVLKCTLSYRAVAGFEPRDTGGRRVPRGEVWFALVADSRFAPPVRINLPISAGGASVRLSSFQRAIVDIVEPAAEADAP